MSKEKFSIENVLDTTKAWKDCVEPDFTKQPDGSIVYNLDRVNCFINSYDGKKTLKENVDLATLLILLKHRHCDIELPYYENTKERKIKSTVEKVGNVSHGKILQLVSNQNTFNFSILMADEKYKEDKLHTTFDYAPRTYTVTNVDGTLNDSWNNFTFLPTGDERDYFKKIIDVDGNITCKHFVNPQLAQAMYTDYYKCMKLLVDRLVVERKYLKDMKNKYLPKCKVLKESEYVLDSTTEKVQSEDKYESVKVKCFETQIDMEYKGFEFNYIDEKLTPNEIVDLCDLYTDGLINFTAEVKFICRAIELAFTLMNPFKEDLSPSELHTYNRYDCKWNPIKVKLPRSRIEWFELMFPNYSILCRYYDKTIKQKIKEE